MRHVRRVRPESREREAIQARQEKTDKKEMRNWKD
jgi:hypothetical protein